MRDVGLPGSAVAIGDGAYAVARIRWTDSAGPFSVVIPSLADGIYRLRQINLDSGEERLRSVTVRGGVANGYERLSADEALVMVREQ